MKSKRFLLIVVCFGLSGLFAHSQTTSELPLRRIALFSSGVGFFEHSGPVAPQTTGINLPFDAGAVNDVLQSLVINDPASTSISVRYASENTLWRTLRSLQVDLSGWPGIAEILNGLRGAELEVTAPNPIRGRIIGVEYRQQWIPPQMQSAEAWLSLFTNQGIRVIPVKDIATFSFIDERINSDLNRALDLIMTSRDESTRNLLVTMDGRENRNVSLSYVIATPVWKTSYRLDLGRREPFLQGWAIVDNDSDTDWKDVELSLVIGRPVSFIQNLFPPYHVFRPVVPLSIAGVAQARTHDDGFNVIRTERAGSTMMLRGAPEMMEMQADQAREFGWAPAPAQAAPAVAGGVMQTAAAAAAGDQFLFTLRNPVSLERRQSAMLPLVEGTVRAERTLIFSGTRALSGQTINPEMGAELINTSGMRLPAGPITVYDGGIYAGDALIEFFPENERRLITFGEDLSVSGSLTSSSSRNITAVNISGGVMTIRRRLSHERTYTLRNSSEEAKRIIIEHPITAGAELAEPASADDRTANLYRFNRNLPSRGTITFRVREETPLSESITLAQLRPEALLSFATNQEIPANVRAALNRAIELNRIAGEAARAQTQLETQLSRLVTDQDRIRRNLEAAGNQSPQGQEYLRRLVALDNEIDNLNSRIEAAVQETQRTRREYENHLATISI